MVLTNYPEALAAARAMSHSDCEVETKCYTVVISSQYSATATASADCCELCARYLYGISRASKILLGILELVRFY